MANSVSVRVGAPGAKQASSEIDQLRDKFAKLQSQGAKGFAIGAGAAITAKGLGLLDTALSNVVGFAGDAAQAFMEDQRSVQQLNTSLKANITGWNGNTDAIERVIKARMALGFTDEEQRQSLALLVAATHDVTKALHIEQVAMDLARFKGISLQEASVALTTIEGGRARGLAQLGINVKDYATTEERLAAVEKVASGQAADYANTLEGKLTVAQVKAHEAEETLGKGLAQLEADVLPAVADGVSNLADGIDSLAYKFGHLTDQIKPDEVAQAFGPFAANWTPAMQDFTQAETDAALAAQRLAEKTDLATGSVASSVPVYSAAELKLFHLGADFAILESNIKSTEGAIEGLTGAIENDLFGKAINAGNEARIKENIRDLLKQREGVDKSSLKWKDLTGQLEENRKALFDLHLTEAAAKGPQAAINFLRGEEKHAGSARAEIEKLIKKYEALAALQGELGPIIVPSGSEGMSRVRHKHATGGYGAPGELSLVGENGPELRVEGNQGSTYYPLNRATGSVGSTVVNINVSTPVLTPGSAEALARYIGPHITRWQQQRGLVSGVRAF